MIPPAAGTAMAPLVPDISIPYNPAKETIMQKILNFLLFRMWLLGSYPIEAQGSVYAKSRGKQRRLRALLTTSLEEIFSRSPIRAHLFIAEVRVPH